MKKTLASERLDRKIENRKLQKQLIMDAIEHAKKTGYDKPFDVAVSVVVALETKFKILRKKEN